MKNLIITQANKYQNFFDFMNQEHNLTLTISEMQEIISEVEKLKSELSRTDSEN